MSITTQRFIRKAFYVDAVEVTATNMEEVAEWCGGRVSSFLPKTEEGSEEQKIVFYVDVPVIRPMKIRHTQAFIGDRVLRAPNRSFKVYTPKAFKAEFTPTDSVEG